MAAEKKEKFTPGPWRATTGYAIGGNHIAVAKGDEIAVALCGSVGSGNEEESIANATLIAAAPDMYEALKRLLEFGQNKCGCGSSDCTFCRARAALSKARGEK